MTAGADETDHLNHSSGSQTFFGVTSALLQMQVSDGGGGGGGGGGAAFSSPCGGGGEED